MASGYRKGCLQLTAGLAQDPTALERLQRIYKLPATFATLPPSETIQALEMLGAISEENPMGLIDLPFLLGMKDSYKIIKRKLKIKRKNPGFMGLNYTEAEAHLSANLQAMMNRVESSYLSLRGQVELLERVILAQTGEEKTLHNVVDALEDAKTLLDESLRSINKSTKQVSATNPAQSGWDHDQGMKPTRFVRKSAQRGKQQLAKEERSNFDRCPSPTAKVKEIHTLPIENNEDPTNGDAQNMRRPRSRSLEMDKVLAETQSSAFSSKGELAVKHHHDFLTLGIKLPGGGTPPSNKSKKPPPPPVKDKPKKKDRLRIGNSPALVKRPIMPPTQQNLLSQKQQRESHRSSAGYTVMNPVSISEEILRKHQSHHNYINVGNQKTRKSSTSETAACVDTDSDPYEEPAEEYEIFLNQ